MSISSHKGPHKYVRVKKKNTGKNKQYKCGIERCPHAIYEGLILGREGQCWKCKGTFTITRRTLRNKYLHCIDCTGNKSSGILKDPQNIDRLLNDIFNVDNSNVLTDYRDNE